MVIEWLQCNCRDEVDAVIKGRYNEYESRTHKRKSFNSNSMVINPPSAM